MDLLNDLAIYVIAKKDPKRPMRKFPWYNFQVWEGTIR